MASLPEHIHRRIDAHNRRFEGLPLIGGKSELPTHDGDIAELHELREILLDGIESIGKIAPEFLPLHLLTHGAIEYDIDLYVEPWPSTASAALAHTGQVIAAWKAALNADRQQVAA